MFSLLPVIGIFAVLAVIVLIRNVLRKPPAAAERFGQIRHFGYLLCDGRVIYRLVRIPAPGEYTVIFYKACRNCNDVFIFKCLLV